MWGKCASTSAPASSFFRLKRSKSAETVETYRTYPQSPYISIHIVLEQIHTLQRPRPKEAAVSQPQKSGFPSIFSRSLVSTCRLLSKHQRRFQRKASFFIPGFPCLAPGWLKGAIFIYPPEKDAHNSKLTIARIYSPIKNINSKALTLLWYVSFPSGHFYCWHQGTPGLQRPRDQHTRRPVSACSA